MTNQEFFDAAVAHLRKQGEKSADSVGACLYEGSGYEPDGSLKVLHCAVGGVMTPEVLTAVKEAGYNRAGVPTLVMHCAPAAEFFAGLDEDLMTDMQNVHDRGPVDEWEIGFHTVARDYGLVYAKAPA